MRARPGRTGCEAADGGQLRRPFFRSAAKLRKEEVETRKHLKQVQKDLRKEVVSLQNTVKWVNILAVPIAVMVSGIVIAVVKRKKTSAK